MLHFASKNVDELYPDLNKKTLTMLLRAESRIVTSISNSRSPHQTREVLEVAYKLADLPAPFGVPKSTNPIPEQGIVSQVGGGVQGALRKEMARMVTLMTNQIVTEITAQIAATLGHVPTAEHYNHLVDAMRASQTSYADTVSKLAESVNKLEEKVRQWETTHLVHLVERLPDKLPPTLSDHSQQEDHKEGGADKEGGVHCEDQRGEPQPKPLKRLEDASLRRCCEKVVASAVEAFRPFKA